MALSGPSAPPASGREARQIIVLLHGVGVDGNDLIALAPMLSTSLPHAHFYAPHAPQDYDMAPFGRQWFSLADRTPSVLVEGLRATFPLIRDYLEGLLDKHQLPASRMAIVGFSQGTMAALFTAPRLEEEVAAVVGFSGALIGPDLLRQEARSRPPILLIHGRMDELVPFSRMAQAQAGLESAGFSVETMARPSLGHGIDEEGLAAATRFLVRHLDGSGG